MKNRYWLIDNTELSSATEIGETGGNIPHKKVHYSPLSNGKRIIQSEYTDSQIDTLRLKPWAFLYGKYNSDGSITTESNIFSNPHFHSGSTSWTLGTGYSVEANSKLVWDSDADTTAVAHQDITVTSGKIYKFTFSYRMQANDIATILASGSINNLNTARVVIKNSSTQDTLATFYTGDTAGSDEKRSFLFKPSVTGLRIEIMGAKAGLGKWWGFSCVEFVPTNHGKYKSSTLSLPTFKGGNFGGMLSSAGVDIAYNWLSSSNYTVANKSAWSTALANMYQSNGLNVCRIFINVAGDFSTYQLFNDDWSDLRATESTNLVDFFNNVVPSGIKIVPVFSIHTGLPDSVYNTTLTPVQAHETKTNFINRMGDVIDLLLPYRSKIAMWEVINEPNLNIGANVSPSNIQGLLKSFYDLVKTKDTTVPVCVSHQNQILFMYHSALIAGTADVIQYHFYGSTPIFPNSATPMGVIPDVMKLPCVMGEGRHIDGGNNAVINAPYLREANNIYYTLGYEGFYPWTIKGYGEQDGSSALDLTWTESIGDSYLE